MEVILIKDVDKLGYANDIVDVRPGYANNYLIPQGLAKSATGFGPQNTGREPQAAGPQGSQAGRRRRGARGQDCRNLAEADGQGRGRTHFRIDHGGSPGRSPRSQGHHGGSQEHLAGCSEDDRSLRSLCQNLQRNLRDRSFRGGCRRVRQSFLISIKDRAPFLRKRGSVFTLPPKPSDEFSGRPKQPVRETAAISTSDSPEPAADRENRQAIHDGPNALSSRLRSVRSSNGSGRRRRGLLRNRQTARGSSAIRSMNRSKCSRRLSFSPRDNFFFRRRRLR